MADDAGKIYGRRSIERGTKQSKRLRQRCTLMKYLGNYESCGKRAGSGRYLRITHTIERFDGVGVATTGDDSIDRAAVRLEDPKRGRTGVARRGACAKVVSSDVRDVTTV
jgi:hypothetical protein